nr:helix-hairpin-helix domain-containing protein [Thermoflexales bacterium]
MIQKTQSTVDLNTADEPVLVKKLRISPRLAKRIIALRPYQSVDQLSKIWGIEPEVLQRILPLVSVAQPEVGPDLPQVQTPVPSETATPPRELTPAAISQAAARLEQPSPQSETRPPAARPKDKPSWKTSLALVVILLVGAYFRLTGLNWDENQHQHPDERYVTMVTDQIRGVSELAVYFDTTTSTLNPLKYGSYTYGMFPLFFTRMIAEWVKMDTYDSITLVGRALSGVFDLAAVWVLYLLGKRLYNKRTGLLAAALGAAAVLPIQLSHYYAVDSFSTVFVVASVYFGLLAIPLDQGAEKPSWSSRIYFGLFGISVGLAGACKVNTLPVFGVIILAGVAKLITARKTPDFRSGVKEIAGGWALAAAMAFLTFRVFQPYAFAGPGLLGLQINQDWLKIIQEVTSHVAGNSDWPPNTHWTNRPITYAWTNMVNWGLGLPLGLAGWLGWAWAAWRMWKGDWRRHLLPFAWVAAYFIWQNAMFWRYMRYFLPIYPFIILFAAWALVELYDRTRESRARLLANGRRLAQQIADWRHTWAGAAAILALVIVLIGSYVYALAFTQIYNRPITRIAASEWMLANIPGPFNILVDSPQGSRSYPGAVGNDHLVDPGDTPTAKFNVFQPGTTSKITAANVRQIGVSLYFRLTRDEAGTDIVTEGRLGVYDDNQSEKHAIAFGDVTLTQGETYYVHYRLHNSSQFSLSAVTLKHVDRDAPALPVDLNLQAQSPGMLQGMIPVTPEESLVINRLDIADFQQEFVPTTTTLKVSLYQEGAEDQPLAEASQILQYSQPGMQFAPTFEFPPVEVTSQARYGVRYEVTQGAPLRVLGENFALETSWDDALPLNIDSYDAQGGIYTPLNLELYEPDTPAKRDAMLKVLASSNYLVIPSNRAYDAMPRLPLRYPMTLKYYQTLFNCECSGDDLENVAYGLQPPFKSPLGFELIATFESSPSLGFLVFPDQAADESFTVYDHPKVMIFKKSADFSLDQISARLNSVDLDQVIFQTPLQYNQSPTAMQLPPDRLAAQTNGASWVSMFDRFSLINANEPLSGILWYLLLLGLGLIAFPIVYAVFSGLPDRGYPLARMAGLIIVAWLAWFAGSLKVLSFSAVTLWLCAGLTLAVSVGLAYRQRAGLIHYARTRWTHILATEIIFLVLFLFSLSIRLGNPDLWHPWLGGEKPMDFAFFNAVLKSVYFPPENPWFSGHYINYYYYGYVIAAIPTKLLGILPSIAYNLILPAWFAMTGVGVFCVGFNLVAGLRKGQPEETALPAARSPRVLSGLAVHGWAYAAGLIAVLAMLIAGNLYEVRALWKYLPEASTIESDRSTVDGQISAVVDGANQVLTGQTPLPGDEGRWYFEASRPILNGRPDTPIAEFPYFTFLYGDLHPHLLTMPFYALALGWILAVVLLPLTRLTWPRRLLSLAMAGLIFGSFRAAHTWDFPTFLGLGAVAILWTLWRGRTDSIQRTLQTSVAYELAFIGLAIALYAPFTEWFRTEYVSLQLWDGLRTPLIDYVFVFGLALFLVLSLFIQGWVARLKDVYQQWVAVSKREPRGPLSNWHLKRYLVVAVLIYGLYALWLADYEVLAFGLPLVIGLAYSVIWGRALSTLRRVSGLLFGLGLLITLFVEVFVLKGDSGRSNMVFRFYNQAWLFFALAISLALVDGRTQVQRWPRLIRYGWSVVLGVLLLSAASYPLIATHQKMTDRWPDVQNPPHVLDGAAFMLGDANG